MNEKMHRIFEKRNKLIYSKNKLNTIEFSNSLYELEKAIVSCVQLNNGFQFLDFEDKFKFKLVQLNNNKPYYTRKQLLIEFDKLKKEIFGDFENE